MPTFTSRRVSAQPLRLTMTFTLEALAIAMSGRRPSLSALQGGWAGPSDHHSGLGVRNAAPPVSDPVITGAKDDRPQRLHARFYYYKEDKRLRELFPSPPQEHHTLQAVDLLLSESRTEPGVFTAAFSTRTLALISGEPLKSLHELAEASGATLETRFDSSEVDLRDPDIFLWLITRTRDNRQIDGDTEIVRIEAVSGQDNSRRLTVLNDDVGFDRPSFLVAVAEVERLGPVRITLRDTQIDCRISFDLWRDGSFAVYSSGTHYRRLANDGDMRATAAQDILYRFLPKLVASYQEDQVWRDAGRLREITAAAAALIARYTDKYPELELSLDGVNLKDDE